jgi:hypothetical protein
LSAFCKAARPSRPPRGAVRVSARCCEETETPGWKAPRSARDVGAGAKASALPAATATSSASSRIGACIPKIPLYPLSSFPTSGRGVLSYFCADLLIGGRGKPLFLFLRLGGAAKCPDGLVVGLHQPYIYPWSFGFDSQTRGTRENRASPCVKVPGSSRVPPDGLVVGSCTSHPGVLGSIPKREEPSSQTNNSEALRFKCAAFYNSLKSKDDDDAF